MFIDLTKAFDYAIREMVMGWAQTMSDDPDARRAHLLKVGVPPLYVDRVLAWLTSNGSLLEQFGAAPEVVGVVRSLHTSSWFQLPGDDALIVTDVGGRQGCKLGALIFNLIYSIALRELRVKLVKAGFVLHIRCKGDDPFWNSNGNDFSWESSAPYSTPIVEITYVDDEAITIAASSPRALWKAINFLLQELIDAFSMFGFRINWNPGKTEAFVTFRGKHAAEE